MVEEQDLGKRSSREWKRGYSGEVANGGEASDGGGAAEGGAAAYGEETAHLFIS